MSGRYHHHRRLASENETVGKSGGTLRPGGGGGGGVLHTARFPKPLPFKFKSAIFSVSTPCL